jgi:hypothetical protein
MEMQPPTEADVIAATDSLRRQKAAADDQIVSLLKMAEILEGMEVTPNDKAHGLAGALAGFLRAWCVGLHENSTALGAAIAHNDRALQAYRSGIVLPGIRHRNISQ